MEEAAPVRPRRRIAAVAAAALIAACNSVYGLDETRLDPPPDLDGDDDGLADLDDNCPGVANASQSDDDEDGIGDVCDGCPFVPDVRQEDRDGDGIGDRCDPHPVSPGDCLVVYDSFADPQAFARQWDIESNAAAPDVQPGAGSVLVNTPADDELISIIPLDGNGARRSDNFDVAALVTTESAASGSSIAIASNATQYGNGYMCTAGNYAVQNGIPILYIAATDSTTPTTLATAAFSSRPVTDKMVLRLVQRDDAGDVRLRCRVEHGVAVAAFDSGATNFDIVDLSGGFSLVNVYEETATIHAVALYRHQPGTACPATEYR